MHQHNPPQFVSHDQLKAIGVSYHRMDGLADDPKLAALREERGYTNFDVVNITKDFPEEKLTQFFDEHLHEDEEIRLCLEGSGFFDLRSKDDKKWIRVHCTPGDLLIVPAGIYHRFTLDEKMSIKAMRLFTAAPQWVPYSRADATTDNLPSRAEYVRQLQKGDAKIVTAGAGDAVIISDGPQSLANYPHARRVGDLVYLSGFSSRRADNTHRGATRGEDGAWELDVYEQTCGVIENMKTVLETSGSDLKHIIDITVFLTDMTNYKRFNEAYNTYFDAHTGPARTTVAVKQLPHPNLLIEIKGVAQVVKK
jgi:reactive intermediate/imine deaminase